MRHGPHHDAHRSTTTGTSVERSNTALSKLASVTSINLVVLSLLRSWCTTPAGCGFFRRGGPERYRGPVLADAHRDLGITNAQFDRAAAHLSGALDELGVPRPLADQVIVIVAKLRPAIVTA